MKSNYDSAIEEVFKHEGGYVDHPSDPGGATNMGITRATLARWRGLETLELPKSEVKSLKKDEAQKIYYENYAKKVKFDDLPSGLDFSVLDYAVNSGPDRSIKLLQNLLGVTADGVIGPNTLEAVRKIKDVKTFINRFNDDRLTFLKGRATFPTFGKGWTRRVSEVREFSLQLASVAPAAEVTKAGFNWSALGPILVVIATAIFGLFQGSNK
jgi:lysozyme family protein